MTTEKSILFPVAIEGHYWLVEAVAREFQCPVVGIVFSEAFEQAMTPERRALFARLYSFPDFYHKHSTTVARLSLTDIRAEIGELERAWSIPSIATIINYDRYLREERNYAKALRLALLYMRFIRHILSQEDVLWLKADMVTFLGLVSLHACVSQGIPAMKPRAACVDDRVEFMDERWNGSLRGWREVYAALEQGANAVPEGIVEEARTWMRNFRSRPTRPTYAEQASRVQFQLGPVLKSIADGIGRKFTPAYWREFFGAPLDRQLHFREPPGRAFWQDFLQPELRGAWQRQSRWYSRTPDLNEPFVYLPLQFSPEISTLTHGLLYEDQAYMAEALAKYLPSGYRLYVKDHTSMVGRRPSSFYKRLEKHYNIELVSPRVSTFDLMRNAAAVATITSTAGWEAFVLGKPVLALGQVFFQEFPNVLHASIGPDLTDRLRHYIEDFEANEAAIERAVIAYFAVTPPGSTGDVGVEIDAEAAPDNAVAFAQGARRQFEALPLSPGCPVHVTSYRLHGGIAHNER